VAEPFDTGFDGLGNRASNTAFTKNVSEHFVSSQLSTTTETKGAMRQILSVCLFLSFECKHGVDLHRIQVSRHFMELALRFSVNPIQLSCRNLSMFCPIRFPGAQSSTDFDTKLQLLQGFPDCSLSREKERVRSPG
jgi:hypothetical protein